MKVSAFLVFAAVVLLGKCAKLPKDSKTSNTAKVVSKVTKVKAVTTKQDVAKSTKHDGAAKVKVVAKDGSNKVEPSSIKHSTSTTKTSTKPLAQKIIKTGKVAAKKNKKNSFWSPKSVIVPHQDTGERDAIVNSHIARNPILDSLYEQRYAALEKVSALNNQIDTLLNRKPVTDGASESSFFRPGAFDSGTYGVQGGTMFLGPANAGDIVGMESAKKRDESSSGRQKNGAIPDASSASPVSYSSQNDLNNAPVDMPQPLPDADPFISPEGNAADNEQQNSLTLKHSMAYSPEDVENPLVLGDPKMFDSACSVLKLTFEHTQGSTVLDDSPQGNNAELDDGAYVSDQQAKSGLSLHIGEDGHMEIPESFKGKPTRAAAVSMWVKLQDVSGKKPLFQTYENEESLHYDLSVVDGRLSWGHLDDIGKVIFHVTADENAKFTPRKWHHIVGAYSDKTKEATLWLDGKKVGKEENVSGLLSRNWDRVSLFKGKTSGDADNVFMFRCSLDRTKVVALYVAAASPKDAKRSQIPKVKKSHQKLYFKGCVFFATLSGNSSLH
ncbi:uncharacterized protein LOC116302991 [Actinia tenebrosa]|uniref:Uncharacterized protein LOC116302991 n=1 Tax=Actinia tenebrosa TaxID=6105 RepID=A0A6P8IP92_ACTTE|nr:uncharacterized protein LOC116302991 [Actinia tenebrosa]XP_031568291.1 uncharacterized protein LOC116302991 [Actinia tenebrosa]